MVITGDMKNQIDKIWDDMFSYGIANPLVVIEQLTYLFFIRSLDMNEEINEKNDEMFPDTPSERIFPQDEYHKRCVGASSKHYLPSKCSSLFVTECFLLSKARTQLYRLMMAQGTHIREAANTER